MLNHQHRFDESRDSGGGFQMADIRFGRADEQRRFTSASLEVTSGEATTSESFSFPINIQQPMIQQVADYFRGRAGNPCSLSEALDTMEIMENC